MPYLDSGTIIPDPKPEARCFWHSCPSYSDELKACARCKLVRYCSTACQKADWENHKGVCREPRVLDVGAWISAHEPELQWAAARALGGYSGSNITSTHGLKFVIRPPDNRAVEHPETSFELLDMKVLRLETKLPGYPQKTPYEHRESIQIRRNGGLGIASVVLEFRSMHPGVPSTYIARKYSLGKPAATSRGYVAEWERVVKSLVNQAHEFYGADVMHAIENEFLPPDSTPDVLGQVD